MLQLIHPPKHSAQAIRSATPLAATAQEIPTEEVAILLAMKLGETVLETLSVVQQIPSATQLTVTVMATLHAAVEIRSATKLGETVQETPSETAQTRSATARTGTAVETRCVVAEIHLATPLADEYCSARVQPNTYKATHLLRDKRQVIENNVFRYPFFYDCSQL